MSDAVVVVSKRTLVLVAAVVVAVVLILGFVVIPGPREALVRAIAPTATADPAVLAQQRTATEHSIQRGYVKATGQLKQVRELTLAISKAEADTIDQKARADLASVRKQALAAVGSGTGILAAQIDQYVATTEAALDVGSFENDPGILLAPALFDIVRRADTLFQQIADDATRQLTRAPATPSPTVRPSPTVSPRASGTASPSPSR